MGRKSCKFRAGQSEKRKFTEVQNPWAFHCLVESSCLQGTEAFVMVVCTCAHLSAEGKSIFTEAGLNIWRMPTLFCTLGSS